MAPKKQRQKAVAKRIPHFVNDEASERFEILKTKPVILERGFQIEKRGWSLSYVEQIEKQGSSSFCHPRTEAVLEWVREFYANARFHSAGKTKVRGKTVDFSELAIHSFFDIPDLGGDDFEKFRAITPPHDVAAALCLADDVRWANEGKYVLDSACFTRSAKVWLMFVNTNIMPTKHSNHVSMERAYIIYCILRGTPVRVGRLISDQLKKKVKTDGGGQLWFPTIITELCRHAGVPFEGSDNNTPVGHHITQKVISSYIKVQKQKDPTVSKAAAPSSPKASSSTTQKAVKNVVTSDAQFTTIMEYLKYMATAQRYHHRHMDAYMDIVRGEQARMMEHAKLAVEKGVFPFDSPFDKKGYLVFDKKRMAPFEDVVDSPDDEETESEKEEDDDEEDDEEDDEDDDAEDSGEDE